MKRGSVSGSWRMVSGIKTTLAVLLALAIWMTLPSQAEKIPGPQGKPVKEKSDTVKKASPKEKLPSPDDFVPVEKMPVQVHVAEPVYPVAAQKAGVEGTVWVRALVDKNGNVSKAVISKGSGHKVGFEKAALKAAYECHYEPAIQNERSVAVWIAYKVVFKLEQKTVK